MHSYDVVGYVFQADILCPDCAVRQTARSLSVESPDDYLDIPEDWAELAEVAGVDRFDESSYDSDTFPKIVFREQVEDDEYCGECGESVN